MKLSVKNMVCDRCVLVVHDELTKLNYNDIDVRLGEVDFNTNLNEEEIAKIDKHLRDFGFEVLVDKKHKLVNQIKVFIIGFINEKSYLIHDNLSDVIKGVFNQDYSSLSNIFSEIESVTIEKYYIKQKIEKAKELIVYDELNFSEIAMDLGYSSNAHFSSQFKKITGVSPSSFKTNAKRKSLDQV